MSSTAKTMMYKRAVDQGVEMAKAKVKSVTSVPATDMLNPLPIVAQIRGKKFITTPEEAGRFSSYFTSPAKPKGEM